MYDYEKVVAYWQGKNVASKTVIEEILDGYVVAFAYHSGNIENSNITYHDMREFFEHNRVASCTGDLRTLYEIRNAKYANAYLFDAFRDRLPLDETFIKELQKRLTLNTYDTRRWQKGERPGEYKKGDYVTGKNETGAAPEEVAEEMQELLEDLKDVPNEKALVGAAFFHAKFENIHPFSDGNGRTGRLAMNYFLVLHNHPPVIIHQEDRKEYFEALEAWDEEQELEPLIKFLKEQLVKTWKHKITEVKSTKTSISKYL